MLAPAFFIIPSLACQAECKYCFGPHRGAIMDERTARETVRFIRGITQETSAEDISITFHGGEPLLAPPYCRHLKTRAEKLIDAAREYVLG